MEKKPALINVGGSSMMMLFAVLCLTVFAVLSLISARSQSVLANKTADSIKDYYTADTAACEIYESIKNGNIPENVTVIEAYGGNYYSYEVTVNDTQALSVLLYEGDGAYEILTWKMYATAEWEADTNLNVWDGK